MSKETEGKEVSAGVEITTQLRQYEPLKLSAHATIPGDPEDEKVWANLWSLLYTQIYEQLEESDQVKQALKR